MNAVARLIVRWYPRAWRERYEAEVLALIDATPLRVGDVCGLLRNGITERVLSFYEPSRHITAYRFISGLALLTYITVLFLTVLAAGAIPTALGYLTQRMAGPFPAGWDDAIAWLYVPVFLLIVPAFVRLFRLQWGHLPEGRPLPAEAAKLRRIIIGGYAVLMVLRGLQPDLSLYLAANALAQSWILVITLWELPEDVNLQWPGRGLFEALGRLRAARHDLRWAQMELDRCEGLYAGREPGPELHTARAETDRLAAIEQAALAELEAMSYHARFRAP